MIVVHIPAAPQKSTQNEEQSAHCVPSLPPTVSHYLHPDQVGDSSESILWQLCQLVSGQVSTQNEADMTASSECMFSVWRLRRRSRTGASGLSHGKRQRLPALQFYWRKDLCCSSMKANELGLLHKAAQFNLDTIQGLAVLNGMWNAGQSNAAVVTVQFLAMLRRPRSATIRTLLCTTSLTHQP